MPIDKNDVLAWAAGSAKGEIGAYLDSVHSEAEGDFLKSIARHRKFQLIGSLYVSAEKIIKEYILERSPREVNVGEDVKLAILDFQRVDGGTLEEWRNLFEDAEQAIASLVSLQIDQSNGQRITSITRPRRGTPPV